MRVPGRSRGSRGGFSQDIPPELTLSRTGEAPRGNEGCRGGRREQTRHDRSAWGTVTGSVPLDREVPSGKERGGGQGNPEPDQQESGVG